jgi:predicted peptidase
MNPAQLFPFSAAPDEARPIRDRISVLLVALLVIFPVAGPARAADPHPKLKSGEFTAEVSVKVGYRYVLYVPEDYKKEDSKKWPLIIFLHGSGERGDDLDVLTRHGPPKMVAGGHSFPAFIISPQAPNHVTWEPHSVKACLDAMEKEYHIDQDRVYITGISMGGYGVWDAIMAYPHTFAAAVPICGSAGVKFVAAERIKHVPVWIFHGSDDTVVPAANSQRIYDALVEAGGTPKLTIYAGVGHDSWSQTYDDPDLWEWLFAQKRGGGHGE